MSIYQATAKGADENRARSHRCLVAAQGRRWWWWWWVRATDLGKHVEWRGRKAVGRGRAPVVVELERSGATAQRHQRAGGFHHVRRCAVGWELLLAHQPGGTDGLSWDCAAHRRHRRRLLAKIAASLIQRGFLGRAELEHVLGICMGKCHDAIG